MTRTIARRHSLFVRLFALGALIAVVAVAAATFATVRSTTVAVQQAQQQSLHDDARAYDALIGYAARHRSWDGARVLVDRLARETGNRVAVTDASGRTLVGSTDASSTYRPQDARARLDPLAVDTTLLPVAVSRPQDAEPVTCPDPSGCRLLSVPGSATVDTRVLPAARDDLGADPLALLQRRSTTCLRRSGIAVAGRLGPDLTVLVPADSDRDTVARCLDSSVRALLGEVVAPPALLFVGDSTSTADVFWDLSRASQLRIALLALGVLTLTLMLGALLARQVVGPLRSMAETARRAGEGDLTARVEHHRRDEVGEVAAAFNTMADRREQLEVARRRLVSDVSHELRTPVSNVRSWVEGAQDGLVERDDDFLASLHEETLHLQRLIEDLHDLSVGDAGELRLDPGPVELPAFLEQVADAFRGAAESRGVVLLHGAEEGATVTADPVRLRQAVSNLVANALRHTPPGGEVRLGGVDGRITVSDTGEGIPAEELPHVFERFRRVDASRSRSSGGSGLGLAIVRQIVEAHQGTAAITSVVGEGTILTLSLPV